MSVQILQGDCREVLRTLSSDSFHCCVTSPPYFGLRDYGCDGQMGREESPDAFIVGMVEVFREVRRVLRPDGTLWLNIGDSYSSTGGQSPQSGKLFNGRARQRENICTSNRGTYDGIKPKDLIGIPWMLAFALRADGWYLRQDIIWHKPNPMPESVRDRCTKSHEYLFLLTKSARYYYDADAVKEDAVCKKMPGRGMTPTDTTYGAGNGGNGGLLALRNRLNDNGVPDETRNRRSVWTVATRAYSGAHFATFPPALIEPCIKAGSPSGGAILDPFGGAGTTGLVADQLGRDCTLIELNTDYAEMACKRIGAAAIIVGQSQPAAPVVVERRQVSDNFALDELGNVIGCAS